MEAIKRVQSVAAAKVARADASSDAREAKARTEATRAAEAAAATTLAEAMKAIKKAEREPADLLAHHNEVLSARLREQRDALENARTDAVGAERSKAFEARQKLEAQLEAVQRQLRQQRSTELGEGAEVDLFEDLKVAFPDDRLSEIPRGI